MLYWLMGVDMSLSLIIAILISFFVAFFITPKFIRFLGAAGIVGRDVQKKKKPIVAEMGGPVVLTGFLAGIFFFVWTKVFLYGEIQGLVEIFAAISTILIITIIGVFDDLSCLQHRKEGRAGFKKFKRIGLKQWQKPLLTLPAAVPLMAIMAGDTSLTFPLIGSVDIGILYPLLLVPLAVVGASNATNMLAGFNGLEAGLGTILLSTLGAYAYLQGNVFVAAIAFVFAVALLGFLHYNWYPAKIMPGDSMPYAIGAVAATVAIIGNMEKFALYCFALWFIEFFLKARSRFKAESFGILQKDGTLKAPYPKIYSIPHAIMKTGRFTEKQVVIIILLTQVLVSAAALSLLLI